MEPNAVAVRATGLDSAKRLMERNNRSAHTTPPSSRRSSLDSSSYQSPASGSSTHHAGGLGGDEPLSGASADVLQGALLMDKLDLALDPLHRARSSGGNQSSSGASTPREGSHLGGGSSGGNPSPAQQLTPAALALSGAPRIAALHRLSRTTSVSKMGGGGSDNTITLLSEAERQVISDLRRYREELVTRAIEAGAPPPSPSQRAAAAPEGSVGAGTGPDSAPPPSPQAGGVARGVITLVNECIDMGPQELKSRIGDIVQRAEELRKGCPDRAQRLTVTQLMFMLTSFKRLCLIEDHLESVAARVGQEAAGCAPMAPPRHPQAGTEWARESSASARSSTVADSAAAGSRGLSPAGTSATSPHGMVDSVSSLARVAPGGQVSRLGLSSTPEETDDSGRSTPLAAGSRGGPLLPAAVLAAKQRASLEENKGAGVGPGPGAKEDQAAGARFGAGALHARNASRHSKSVSSSRDLAPLSVVIPGSRPPSTAEHDDRGGRLTPTKKAGFFGALSQKLKRIFSKSSRDTSPSTPPLGGSRDFEREHSGGMSSGGRSVEELPAAPSKRKSAAEASRPAPPQQQRPIVASDYVTPRGLSPGPSSTPPVPSRLNQVSTKHTTAPRLSIVTLGPAALAALGDQAAPTGPATGAATSPQKSSHGADSTRRSLDAIAPGQAAKRTAPAALQGAPASVSSGAPAPSSSTVRFSLDMNRVPVSTLEVVCRVCERRVPASLIQDHTPVCGLVEAAMGEGATDAMLHRLGEALEAGRIIALDGLAFADRSDCQALADACHEAASLVPDGSRRPLGRCEALIGKVDKVLRRAGQRGGVKKMSRFRPAEGSAALAPPPGVAGVDRASLALNIVASRLVDLMMEKERELLPHMPAVASARTSGGFSTSQPSSAGGGRRTTIDDFEILKPISRGAHGRVYLARKKATSDLFAIKVLRKDDLIRKNLVQNVRKERDILSSTNNPFVVRLFYSFTSRNNVYLVMEYLSGGDLFSLLQTMGCLDEAAARSYAAEAVLSLEYCHRCGIVHRDVKPDNLLVGADGHLKLTDFGLSTMGVARGTAADTSVSGRDPLGVGVEGVAEDSFRPRETRKLGTPDYLAPEILLGQSHGPEVDWWALGVVIYEMVCGVPPFNADTPEEIFDNILERHVYWPQELSPELRGLIDSLLQLDPTRRLGHRGAAEVKAHPFFRTVEWGALLRTRAAFIPETEHDEDTSYFAAKPFSQKSVAADLADQYLHAKSPSPQPGQSGGGPSWGGRASRLSRGDRDSIDSQGPNASSGSGNPGTSGRHNSNVSRKSSQLRNSASFKRGSPLPQSVSRPSGLSRVSGRAAALQGSGSEARSQGNSLDLPPRAPHPHALHPAQQSLAQGYYSGSPASSGRDSPTVSRSSRDMRGGAVPHLHVHTLSQPHLRIVVPGPATLPAGHPVPQPIRPAAYISDLTGDEIHIGSRNSGYGSGAAAPGRLSHVGRGVDGLDSPQSTAASYLSAAAPPRGLLSGLLVNPPSGSFMLNTDSEIDTPAFTPVGSPTWSPLKLPQGQSGALAAALPVSEMQVGSVERARSIGPQGPQNPLRAGSPSPLSGPSLSRMHPGGVSLRQPRNSAGHMIVPPDHVHAAPTWHGGAGSVAAPQSRLALVSQRSPGDHDQDMESGSEGMSPQGPEPSITGQVAPLAAAGSGGLVEAGSLPAPGPIFSRESVELHNQSEHVVLGALSRASSDEVMEIDTLEEGGEGGGPEPRLVSGDGTAARSSEHGSAGMTVSEGDFTGGSEASGDEDEFADFHFKNVDQLKARTLDQVAESEADEAEAAHLASEGDGGAGRKGQSANRPPGSA